MTAPAIAIIQARMSSTRLPGKVLMPLAGKPMIWHIVERARACTTVDTVIVATSEEATDDELADYCQRHGIKCFRGSLDNVLSRYLEILDRSKHPYCVRITADCPLIDPDFIDLQVRALITHHGDQVYLTGPASVLCGQSVHSSASLRMVEQNSNHPDDLEHVGSRYFAENPDKFKIVGITPPIWLGEFNFRLTVDEMADYEMMSALYKDLWGGDIIPLRSALEWLDSHPFKANINNSVGDSLINRQMQELRRDWSEHVSISSSWD